MTRRGTSDGGRVRALRALTAVVALYALMMQALLGRIADLRDLPFGPPFDVASALPCLDKGDAAAGTDPAPQDPGHPHHHACCTAAYAAAGTPPPLPAVTAIVWPPRPAVRVVWRMEGVASARAPPFTLASARAPPAV